MPWSSPGPARPSARRGSAPRWPRILDEVDGFRSAQEVHDLLRHRGERVGLTTVYRPLQVLADSGEVDVLRTADGEVDLPPVQHRPPPPPGLP